MNLCFLILVNSGQKAVEVYTDMGRLNMAARQLKEIAEAQEKQGLKDEAVTFYSQVTPRVKPRVTPVTAAAQ
jgi:hypothetical protein